MPTLSSSALVHGSVTRVLLAMLVQQVGIQRGEAERGDLMRRCAQPGRDVRSSRELVTKRVQRNGLPTREQTLPTGRRLSRQVGRARSVRKTRSFHRVHRRLRRSA